MNTKIIINADGGSRGNPGMAGIGIVIRDEKGNILEEYKEYIGITTNNVAEYKTLIKGLTLAKKYAPDEVHIIMDSELIIRHMRGEYKVKAEHLKPLYIEAKRISQEFKHVVYEEVPREQTMQAKADALVNEAIDEEIRRKMQEVREKK